MPDWRVIWDRSGQQHLLALLLAGFLGCIAPHGLGSPGTGFLLLSCMLAGLACRGGYGMLLWRLSGSGCGCC